MKRLYILTAFLAACVASFGQAITVEDPNNMDPASEIKIIVDLTQTSNDWGIVELAAGGEDMYIWTWKPAEHPSGHPLANGIGATAWKNSNEALKMTMEAPGIYSYTMTPTEFYEVSPKEVYDNDIHLLVKPLDGGGYGEDDRKTEDLVLEFELPAGPSKILFAFPSPTGPELDTVKLANDDVFSIVYDVKVEEKESMQDATDVYVYPIATGSDSVEYKIAVNAKKVADFSSLQMKAKGDGVFQWSHFVSNLPALFSMPTGVTVSKLKIVAVKPNLVNSNDATDEEVDINLVICD